MDIVSLVFFLLFASLGSGQVPVKLTALELEHVSLVAFHPDVTVYAAGMFSRHSATSVKTLAADDVAFKATLNGGRTKALIPVSTHSVQKIEVAVTAPGKVTTTYSIWVRRYLKSSAKVGSKHACYLAFARVVCWGSNTKGQLGIDDTTTDVVFPASYEVLFTGPMGGGVVEIATGVHHSCALDVTGRVLCWGDNDQFQLGLAGSGPTIDMPSLISPISFAPSIMASFSVVQIAAGGEFTCALFTNARTICWGDNSAGQLGLTFAAPRYGNMNVLTQAAFMTFSDTLGAVQLSLGSRHACAVFTNSKVRCWGANDAGQLGDGSLVNRITLTAATFAVFSPTIEPIPVLAVSAASKHTCALFDGGRVLCWGNADDIFPGRLGSPKIVATCVDPECVPLSTATFVSFSRPTDIVLEVATSNLHTCVLFQSGRTLCFGTAEFGRLGSDSSLDIGGPVGVAVSLAPHIAYSGSSPPVVQIAAGEDNTCVVRCDGTVICFGGNDFSVIGQDSTAAGASNHVGDEADEVAMLPPIVFGFPSGSVCAQIDAIAVNSRTDVPLGVGVTFYNLWVIDEPEVTLRVTPSVPSATITVRGVDQGTAVELSRHVVNLVTVTVSAPPAFAATYTLAITRYASASTASMDSSQCLLSAGRVACWGSNVSLETGLNSPGNVNTGDGTGLPMISVGYLGFPRPNAYIVDVGAQGGNHACVLFDDGRVTCWGFNSAGQAALPTASMLLSGALTDTAPFIAFSASVTHLAVQIVAALDSTCVLFSHGRILCWGGNDYGQVGRDSSSTSLPSPEIYDFIPFSDTVPTTRLAGHQHFCAILVNRNVRCWGRNDEMQLGNGNTVHLGTGAASVTMSTYVTFAASINTVGVASVSAGAFHTCALFYSGRMLCWGGPSASDGQLGVAAVPNVALAAYVSFSDNYVPIAQIACGHFHTCALFTNGKVTCFGLGGSGQLGTDDMVSRGSATAVNSLPYISFSSPGIRVTFLSAGATHTCVMRCDGALLCFGGNGSGQLGRDEAIDYVAPIASLNPIAFSALAISAAPPALATLSLTSPSSSPVAVPIAACETHYVARVVDSASVAVSALVSAASAGARITVNGQAPGARIPIAFHAVTHLSVEVTLEPFPPTRYTVAVRRLSSGAVATGKDHACMLFKQSTANDSGQLGQDLTVANVGDGAYLLNALPKIPFGSANGLDTTPVLEVVAGSSVTCILVSTGRAACWGSNADKRLGAPLSSPFTSIGRNDAFSSSIANLQILAFPAEITEAVVQIAFAAKSTCALFSHGRLLCWGLNGSGELGVNILGSKDITESSFIVFSDSLGASYVAGGGEHFCAVFRNSRVRCWGLNDQQQLGDRTEEARGTSPGTNSVQSSEYVTFSPTINSQAVISLALGEGHSCGLFSSGGVLCWGALGMPNGQLGTVFADVPAVFTGSPGSDDPVSSVGFVSFSSASVVASVTAGAAHTCVLFSHGGSLCFGQGTDGQLGTGLPGTSVANSGGTLLTSHPLLAGSYRMVVAGGSFTCLLRCDQKIICIGSNASGQLGIDSGVVGVGSVATATPVAVAGTMEMPSTLITALELSGTAGTLVVPLDPCTTFYSVQVVDMASLAVTKITTLDITASATIGGFPALGTNVPLSLHAVNLLVVVVKTGASLATYTFSIRRLASLQIAAGKAHACLLASRRVLCWGGNTLGQLGQGSPAARIGKVSGEMSLLPYITFRTSLQAESIVEVSAHSSDHTCALFAWSTTVVCWGSNAEGELNNSDTQTPLSVGSSASDMTSLAPIAFKPTVTDPIVQILAASGHTCALSARGAILCWGSNAFGQLGRPTASAAGSPIANLETLTFSDSLPALQLSGYKHTCAVFVNQRVRCWGGNRAQQLGDGTFVNRGSGSEGHLSLKSSVFVTFAPSINTVPVVAVEAGMAHSCALFSNGRVLCWGGWGQSVGQLGTNYAMHQSVATCSSVSCLDVSSAAYLSFSNPTASVLQVSAGMLHTCVIFRDNQSLCFGSGKDGETGIEGTASVAGPSGPPLSSQPVIGFRHRDASLVAAALGARFTCVLRCDAAVLCFGTNQEGQLGRGEAATVSYGAQAGEMFALEPIAWNHMALGLEPAALTSLSLNTGAPIPLVPCQTIYNVFVADLPLIGFSVQTRDPAATVTVNGAPVNSAHPTPRHVVTLFRITVTSVTTASLTYTIGLRRIASTVLTNGEMSNCLVLSGRVTCWGFNVFGELGRDNIIDVGGGSMSDLGFISFRPSLNTVPIVEVVGHQYGNCALFTTGRILCWGHNGSGQLGADLPEIESIGSNPGDMTTLASCVFAPSLTHAVAQVVSASFSTCALFTHGRILCWGTCTNGRCGRDNQDFSSGHNLLPLRGLALISFSDSVPAVFLGAGSRFYCAVFANERVRCWGRNTSQELGDRTTVNKGSGTTSTSITRAIYITFSPTINTIPIVAVEGGRAHACALFKIGRIICWGTPSQSEGQLGTDFSVAPAVGTCGGGTCVPVSSVGFVTFSNTALAVVQISVSDSRTCVLFENGRTLCFGDGYRGANMADNNLDIGTLDAPLSLQGFISFSDNTIPIATVASAAEHTCVLRCDHRVLCAGINYDGRLGIGSMVDGIGRNPGDMARLQPVALNPALLPPPTFPLCPLLASPSPAPPSPTPSPSASPAPVPPPIAPLAFSNISAVSVVILWTGSPTQYAYNLTRNGTVIAAAPSLVCCTFVDASVGERTTYAYSLTAVATGFPAASGNPAPVSGAVTTLAAHTVTAVAPRFAGPAGGTLVTLYGSGFPVPSSAAAWTLSTLEISLAGLVPLPVPAQASNLSLSLTSGSGANATNATAPSTRFVTMGDDAIVVLSPALPPTALSPLAGPAVVRLAGLSRSSPAPLFMILTRPAVDSIVPAQGPPGTLVTLLGLSFSPAAASAGAPGAAPPAGTVVFSVTVAGFPCDDLRVESDVRLTCVVSLTGVGSGPAVAVAPIAGASPLSSALFTFVPAPAASPTRPVVTLLTPSSGPLVGGTTVTISGARLGASAGDLLETRAGVERCRTVTHVSSTRVVCVTGPSPSLGPAPVIVTTALGGSSSSTGPQFNYTYPPPTILAANPRVVQAPGGGTVITLRGTYFGDSPLSSVTVYIAGAPCLSTTRINETFATCVAPPHPVTAEEERVLVSIVVDGERSRDTDVGFRLAFRYSATVCEPICEWNQECSLNAVCGECAPGFAGPRCRDPLIRVTPPVRLETSEDGLTTEAFFAPTYPLERDVVLTFASSNAREGVPEAPTLLLRRSAGTAGQRMVFRGVPDSIRDGKVAWTATVTFDPTDPFLGRAAPVALFDLVNLDSRPTILSLMPRAVPMLGGPATITGTNWDYVVALRVDGVDIPLANITRLAYMDGTPVSLPASKRAGLHERRQQRVRVQQVEMGMQIELGQEQREFEQQVELGQEQMDVGQHVAMGQQRWQPLQQQQQPGATVQRGTDSIRFLAPRSEVQGYVPVTVVNIYGGQEVEDERVLYYTDDCPKEGQYGRGLDCRDCPEGAECPGGYRLWPKGGYWNPREDSGYVVRCNPPEACIGTKDRLCAVGYEGYACSECSEGYVKTLSHCELCPSNSGQVALLVADVCVWLLLMLSLWTLSVREYIMNVLSLARCLQQLSSIGSSADESFNPFVRRVFQAFTLFSGDISFVKVDCFGKVNYAKAFYLQLAYSVSLGVVLFAGLLVARAVSLALGAHRGRSAEYLEERRRFYSHRARFSLLVYLSSIYYVLTRRAVSALTCVSHGPSGGGGDEAGNDTPSSVRVLLGAPYVTCFRGDHVGVAAVSIVIITVLTVAFPIVSTILYVRNDSKIMAKDKLFHEKWDFFIQPMRPKRVYRYAFWVTEIIFNIILVICDSVLIGNSRAKMAIVLPYMGAMVIAAFALRPFNTFMEGMINVMIWVTGILAVISNYLHTERNLGQRANKIFTYVIVMLTFAIMFAIAFHIALSVFSKQRKLQREKKMATYAVDVAPDDNEVGPVGPVVPGRFIGPVAPTPTEDKSMLTVPKLIGSPRTSDRGSGTLPSSGSIDFTSPQVPESPSPQMSPRGALAPSQSNGNLLSPSDSRRSMLSPSLSDLSITASMKTAREDSANEEMASPIDVIISPR